MRTREQVLARLGEMARLAPGHDDAGGLPPTLLALRLARLIVAHAHTRPVPHAAATAGGGVSLAWETGGVSQEVEISAAGEVAVVTRARSSPDGTHFVLPGELFKGE